jgi:hypothetical protein
VFDATGLMGLLLMIVGVLLLAVALPLIGSFLLDGLIQIVRGDGLRVFGLAAVLSLVTALVGVALLVGARQVTDDMVSLGMLENGLSGLLSVLVPAMVVLAAIQFVRRQVRARRQRAA